MSFFKHVGSVNGKKVIIVQRQLPSEDHMAGVIYSDIMPSKYHDDVMKLLESVEGQEAYEFKDILQRRMMATGDNMLTALGGEGYIKKVPTQNVMVTPNSKSSVRLDELNNLLNMAGKGEEAVRKLNELDAKQGMGKQAPSMNVDDESVSMSDLNIAPTAQPVQANNTDQTALMMEMMKTMQAMQAEINNLKSPTTKRGRPAKSTESA